MLRAESSKLKEKYRSNSEASSRIVLAALKTLTKGGLIVLMAIATNNLLTFVRRVIIVRSLPKGDFGVYTLGIAILAFITIFASLGLLIGSQRYIAFFYSSNDYGSVKGVVYSTIKIMLVSTAVLSLGILFLINHIANIFNEPGLKTVMYLILLILPLSLALSMLTSFYTGFKVVSVQLYFVSLLFNVVSITFILLAFQINRSVGNAFLGMLLAYMLSFGALLIYSKKHFPVRLRAIKKTIVTKQLLLLSLPIFVMNLTVLVINQISILIMGFSKTAEVVGTYGVATSYVQFVEMIFAALVVIFLPVITGMTAKGEKEEAKRVYSSATKWVYILSVPLFATFLLFPSESIKLMFGSRYVEAATIVQILCIGRFFNILFGPNGELMLAYGRTGLLMINALAGGVVNICLNVLLVPHYGASGAAISFAISVSILNLSTAVELFLLYGIQPFDIDYLKQLGLGVLVVTSLFYPFRFLFKRVFWLLPVFYPAVLALMLVLMSLTRSISEMDKELLASMLGKLKSFFRKSEA